MGFYTARVLAELENRSGGDLRDRFDLIVGTSIGGILALAIASRVPMNAVSQAFEARGAAIFSDRPAPITKMAQARDLLRFISGSKYTGSALSETVEGLLSPGQRMGDIGMRVAVSSVNLTRGIPHTFRTPYLMSHSGSANVTALDVALAASAAPTLMPIHRIGQELFCDGAVYANSPDLIGLHEAETLCGVSLDEIHMLSIGTTSADYEFPAPESPSFGLREWANEQKIVKVMMACQQSHARRIADGRLGRRYVRLDEVQTPEQSKVLGLDVASHEAIAVLRSMAKVTAGRTEEDEKVNAFLRHQAQPVIDWFPGNGILPKVL